jgi:hypothetical protein
MSKLLEPGVEAVLELLAQMLEAAGELGHISRVGYQYKAQQLRASSGQSEQPEQSIQAALAAQQQ